MTEDEWLEGVMRDQAWSAISDALGSLGYELNSQEAVEAFVEDLLAAHRRDRTEPRMTPAEMRAAAGRVITDPSFQYDGWYDDLLLVVDAARRLADVIELHQPVRPGIYAEVECWKCHDYSTDPIEWPCQTAIAALGEETAYRLKYLPTEGAS